MAKPHSLSDGLEAVQQPAQQSAESSLAIMKADIDKALQAKQQAKISGAAKVSAKQSAYTDEALLDAPALSRVIEMAWEDRTPFAAIEYSYGLKEADVIALMRRELKPSSFRLWRKRVTGRNTKHQAKRSFEVGRAYCQTQYKQR